MLKETRWGVLLCCLGMGTISLAQPAAAPLEQAVVDSSAQASRWPKHIQSSAGEITIFQPQLEDFQGDTLSARAAVSVTDPQQQTQTFGAVWLKSRVATDRVARTVQILDVQITKAHFPNTEDAAEQKLTAAIRDGFKAEPITLSLDQLLAMLQTVQKEQQAAAEMRNDPPKVIFRDHAAIKVQYDGKPKLVQANDAGLMRAANTPFFVVLDPTTKQYYLKGAGKWFSAGDLLGPFKGATEVPAAVADLADSSDYKDPQQPLTNAQAAGVEIVTAIEPTELIWTDGQPEMGTIPGTGLLYVTNTDADMFLLIDTQQIFLLLSGRWYEAANRNGPWTFVAPDKLPEDFKHIPSDSEKGDVLAHVAGTAAADDAVADSYVPQTAAVDRKQFDQPPVEYDGDPKFEAVEGTPVSYGVNTSSSVVLVGGRYYCCHDAVWYLGAAPVGPWEVCTAVPVEIYQLPPSCPIYSVRYVYVYGYTPEVVYCGYTPGYVGCYTYSRVVVYGTGYRYRAWEGRRYYPRPLTFGFAAHYNSYAGHWGFDFGLATGGGGIWIGQGPRAWGRAQPWFGYGGYRPVIAHRDVHIDTFRREYVARVREERPRPAQQDTYVRNVYDRRHDVHWDVPRQAVQQRRDDGRGTAENARERQRDDVFTDHNGNVYRKTVDGWESRDKGQWKEAPAPAPERRENPPPERKGHPEKAEPEKRPSPAPATPTPKEPAGHNDGEGKRPEKHGDDGGGRDLNRDYRARAAGEGRLHNYEGPAAPAPAPARPGRGDSGGADHGGDRGGSHGNSADHAAGADHGGGEDHGGGHHDGGGKDGGDGHNTGAHAGDGGKH